jgi:hypothetical protein
VRPHKHISCHWNNVAEQVLDRVRVLAAYPHINLELVVLLMDILFERGKGWISGVREMEIEAGKGEDGAPLPLPCRWTCDAREDGPSKTRYR